MPSLTLKNIPVSLYERLKSAAKRHRRSINSELIHCLETLYEPKRIGTEERLARAQELRSKFRGEEADPAEIMEAIDAKRS